MSQSYFFGDQAGSIPGIPGTFSHCRVDTADDGTITALPLIAPDNVAGEQQVLILLGNNETGSTVVVGQIPIQPQEAQPIEEQEQATVVSQEPEADQAEQADDPASTTQEG